jgi:hypothetical protein
MDIQEAALAEGLYQGPPPPPRPRNIHVPRAAPPPPAYPMDVREEEPVADPYALVRGPNRSAQWHTSDTAEEFDALPRPNGTHTRESYAQAGKRAVGEGGECFLCWATLNIDVNSKFKRLLETIKARWSEMGSQVDVLPMSRRLAENIDAELCMRGACTADMVLRHYTEHDIDPVTQLEAQVRALGAMGRAVLARAYEYNSRGRVSAVHSDQAIKVLDAHRAAIMLWHKARGVGAAPELTSRPV